MAGANRGMSIASIQAAGRLLFATCIATIVWATPAVAKRTELLFIVHLRLAPGEYVAGFELRTWTVRVLAVCNLPVGWTVTAGTFGDPGGILSGTANIGVAYLPKGRTGALHALFLVEIGQDRPADVIGPNGEIRPATFVGSIAIGRYGAETTARTVALSGHNLERRPATRCPPPTR